MATPDEQTASGPILGSVGGEYTDEERERYTSEVAPHRDEVLKLHGSGDLELYERLLRDDQVAATFQQRRAAVTALPWQVDAGGPSALDQAAADDLREQLHGLSWDRITHKMLSGLMYGYAIGECMYEPDGTRVRLADVLVRRARRFRFGVGGKPIMVRPKRLEAPDRKFWTFTCGADDDDNVYGLGLGHWLYWPVWFKRNGIKFWALWLERFAAPTPVARGGAAMTEDDERKLLDILRAITEGGRIVIPKHVEIELLEAAKDAGNNYDLFAARMDRAISKVVLSQTMTTDDGASLSQAKVHSGVASQVKSSDSALICESFCRGPATWLTEWNFPGAATPIVWRNAEEPDDLAARAQRDKTILELGFAPTPAYIAETYGDGFVRQAPTPDAAPAGPVSFAAPELLDQGWREIMGPEVDAIEELLADAGSLEEVRRRLGELAARDPQALTAHLARTLFAARMAGELDADTGDDR